jgi:chromosome segregation protein
MSNPAKGITEPSIFPAGAEWLRADFHLHTAADSQFKYADDPAFYNSAYVAALERAGIRLGLITNHNKFDATEFRSLRSTARKNGIALLPGVELSVDDGANGVHTLVIFSDEWLADGQDYINSFLSVAFEGKTPGQYEHENGRCSHSLKQTIKTLEGYERDFFLVFAHVEQKSGLWEEMDGGRIEELGQIEFFRRRTMGFQKVRTHDGAGKDRPCRTKVQAWLKDWYPAEVEGSDPKSIEEIGKGEACYLKLGELSFEAVKFALFDHEHRVGDKQPASRKLATVREIHFEGATLDGRSVTFSPSLTCLIGPRGSGKSAIIECLRHALSFQAGTSDEKYKAGLVERMLTPAGKVIVNAADEFGREIRIEREHSSQPSIFVDGNYRDVSPSSLLKDILYFGQKDLSTRSEAFDETFLEKLLADRVDPRTLEEARLIESVGQAARQLKETLEVTEKLAAYRKEKNELEVQLQVYADKGVDKKLEEMTLFDADRQAIVAWQTSVADLGRGLRGSVDGWEDIDAAFPTARSKLIEAILEDLRQAKASFAKAKQSAQASLDFLREGFDIVANGLKKLEPIQVQLKANVAALQKELKEPQLDLEVFRKKKARLEQLNKLLDAGAQRAKTEQAARDIVGAAVTGLHDFWRERFQERETEVRKLEAELPPEIRIRTSFKGKRMVFEEFLRTVMKGSGVQGASYETLRDAFVDGRELYQGQAELEKHLSETVATKVRTALLDHLSKFLTFRTPDETGIHFQDKPLGDYSLGQRATVILHILMHLRRHPVILIDQPEDDLDNETLYSHFIRQLLERKDLTQFIFATHNPNIPVLGDAEQVVVCRKEGDDFSFEHGSIDAKNIQGRIVTVMEGGEDAFRRRKEIYQLWKSSN